MNFKTISALILGLNLSASVYAASNQPSQEEATVVGACMVQKFTNHTPAIPQDKIEKCADESANGVAKCLGITEDDYNGIIKTCIAQLVNDKCVSAKIKVPLMEYANCGYEKDTDACYKKLGSSSDKVKQLSAECQKK